MGALNEKIFGVMLVIVTIGFIFMFVSMPSELRNGVMPYIEKLEDKIIILTDRVNEMERYIYIRDHASRTGWSR